VQLLHPRNVRCEHLDFSFGFYSELPFLIELLHQSDDARIRLRHLASSLDDVRWTAVW
jgi:hypothetical protein